jgi:formylglycine-generating enzyme required for sulfatase activity
VTIGEPFAVGRFAVTRDEFEAFVKDSGYQTDGGCYIRTRSTWNSDSAKSWRSPGFTQTGVHPVVCVNWNDTKAYVAWLSKKTGKEYRLLSEAEREYVARAGRTTPFWWGSQISVDQANYDGNYTYNGGSKGEWRQKTVPVKSFQANPWGLYQVHGNVWDWVEDCWHGDYHNAPSDGSAWTTGECKIRMLRGGSWINYPRNLRAAYRENDSPGSRNNNRGFRVALGWQDLNR